METRVALISIIAATYLLNNLKCGIGDISKKKGDFSWTPE